MTPTVVHRPLKASLQQVFPASCLLAPTQQCDYAAHYFNLSFPLFALPKQAEMLQVTAWFPQRILKFNLKLTPHYFGCSLVRHQPAPGTIQQTARLLSL